jgi:hypothetical protein
MTRLVRNIHIFIILASLLLAACSGIKHLPPGEKLYTGADVKLEDNENLKRKKNRSLKTLLKRQFVPCRIRVFWEFAHGCGCIWLQVTTLNPGWRNGSGKGVKPRYT